jgi:hypothetical protein
LTRQNAFISASSHGNAARGGCNDPLRQPKQRLSAGLFGDRQSSGDVEVVEEGQRDLVLGDVAVAGRGPVAPQVLELPLASLRSS